MPYNLVTAKAYDQSLDDRWVDVDLTQEDVNETFERYTKVYLKLTHPALPAPQWMDLDAARGSMDPYIGTRTFNQWLSLNADRTLPLLSSEPSFTEYPARYKDALQAGYTIQPFKIGVSPDVVLPKSDRRDLLLRKPGVDFNQYWKYLLVTVNGLFHRVGNGNDSLHVVDGGYSGALYNDTHVGLYSFLEVGELQIVPITPTMLYKNDSRQRWADRVNIKLPSPIEGRTPLLVLGGYLHALDDSYYQTGTHTLAVDTRRIPLVERIHESRQRIDLSSLRLETGVGNDAQYSMEQLEQDRVIQAYFTLSQSFIVLVNTPYLYKRHHAVERTQLPGRYLSYRTESRYPLIGPLGQVHDYVLISDWGKTLLAAKEVVEHQYLHLTTNWFEQNSVDDSLYSGHPIRYAHPQLLELGRFA